MNEFIYEIHAHTSEVSVCGQVSAKEAVRLHRDKGYSGLVITDHFYEGFFTQDAAQSWSQQVARFLRGYELAYDAGQQLGMDILLGAEVRFLDDPTDYLLYGISERFLQDNEKLYEMDIRHLRQLADEHNLLIYQAHPFRREEPRLDNEMIDGMEVINGNLRHNNRNDVAQDYAKAHGLKMIAGSDFHQLEDLARCGVVFPERVRTEQDLVRLLRQDKVRLVGE